MSLKNLTTIQMLLGEVSAGSFWKGMTDWASGSDDLDTVLKEIDAS